MTENYSHHSSNISQTFNSLNYRHTANPPPPTSQASTSEMKINFKVEVKVQSIYTINARSMQRERPQTLGGPIFTRT